MQKSILITGINGFVGTNIIKEIQNNSIYGVDIIHSPKNCAIKTYSWKYFDKSSNPMYFLPQFETIIHLAGKAHDTKNKSQTEEYFEINTGLTKKSLIFFSNLPLPNLYFLVQLKLLPIMFREKS